MRFIISLVGLYLVSIAAATVVPTTETYSPYYPAPTTATITSTTTTTATTTVTVAPTEPVSRISPIFSNAVAQGSSVDWLCFSLWRHFILPPLAPNLSRPLLHFGRHRSKQRGQWRGLRPPGSPWLNLPQPSYRHGSILSFV